MDEDNMKKDEERGERGEKPIFDIFKRIIKTGTGALELTEEGLRNILGEVKLPSEFLKEVLSRIEIQLSKTKEGFLDLVGKEIKKAIQDIDPSQEVAKVLDRYSIDIRARIDFTPKEKGNSAKKKEGRSKRGKG